jgi:Arc/MetJ-type ribon-helix-helix transcriptional regulator
MLPMTPKPSKAVAAVEKLPQAGQDALADLLVEAAARAPIDDVTAIAELRTLLATAEASGVGDRSMTDLIEAARDVVRERRLLAGEVCEEQVRKLDALREAIAEGEASGAAEPFDFEAFLAAKRAAPA